MKYSQLFVFQTPEILIVKCYKIMYVLPKVGKTVVKSDLIIDDGFLFCFVSGTIFIAKQNKFELNPKLIGQLSVYTVYATETKST